VRAVIVTTSSAVMTRFFGLAVFSSPLPFDDTPKLFPVSEPHVMEYATLSASGVVG
jgi:hypothetical protein